MNYYYYNRGKCSSCSEIIWTTELFSSVECSCYNSLLSYNPSQSLNIIDISNEEFINAIKQEHSIKEEEEIVLIKI